VLGERIGRKYVRMTIFSVLVASTLADNLPLNTLSVEAASNLLQTTSKPNSQEGVSITTVKVNATSKKVTTSAIETITKISKGTVVFGKKTFKYDKSLNGFFSNSNALKSAKIRFTYDSNKVIKQLMYLEINATGKVSKSGDKTFKNNSVLDGKGIVINGKIKVNADYITLKNITATKDLELSSKVKNVFYTSKVTVKGKTFISSSNVVKTASTNSTNSGKKSLGQAFYKSLSYVVPTSFLPTSSATQQITSTKLVLVFEGSKLSKIEIKSNDTTVQTVGNTTITDLSLAGNSSVQNGEGSTITNVNLQNGANEVSLNGNIGTVNVGNSGQVQLNGNGTISTLRITANGSSVELNINGVIHTINAVSLGSNLSVSNETNVDKVIVTKEFEITSLDGIGQLIVNGTVPNLTVNAPIQFLQVNGNVNLTIDGTGSIGELNLNTSNNVQINLPKVELLSASESNKGKVTLGSNTKIGDAESKELFQNQDQLSQVELINGKPVGGTELPPIGGGIPSGPIMVANPENYVQKQDFGYWEDAGAGRPAYNVGFKLDLTKLPYNYMKEIKVTLLDANGNTVATRTATGNQIQSLKADDVTYGGLDGQLSVAFLQRDNATTNNWWTSSSYDFTTPAKAVIQITDIFNQVYKVENTNPTGVPAGPVMVANPDNFVQTQDFGYWEDAGAGRPAYNVGFKLDLTKLPYDLMKEIKVTLLDDNGNTVATRTATGNQIQTLKSDDEIYGGLDGQLSAAFLQRDNGSSNNWWTSSSYDFTTPTKAVIQITDKDNKVYKVENTNPSGIPVGPVANSENFVQAQDFGYWEDAGAGRPAYNVGFKLDLTKLPYNLMKEIKITLLDESGNAIATRTATPSQIQKLKEEDGLYGGLDGQLSAAFIQRDREATNDWWTSTAYDFTTPAKAVIQITDKDNKVYKVENNNPTGVPAPEVPNPENFVQAQDFGYWEDAGAGRPAYNVGFKLDLTKLPYNLIKEIKITLLDESGNAVATRTATGDQIQTLKADDETYGGLDGQLSAAFIQRDREATNDWWTSTSYDFTTPATAVIQITDKDNKVYKVENGNPSGIPVGPVLNSDSFVQPQDFGFWNNYDGEGNFAYNVGFKLDVNKLPYNMIREIKIMLVDESGYTVATRTATGTQIEQLKADDETYGGTDGQLSAAFIQRDSEATNDWWASTAYDFSTPTKAVIQITDKDQKVYLVENSNPAGIPNNIMLTNQNSTSYYTNLETAVNAAQDGDIIYVPKGNYELDSQIRIEKSITLFGAGASTIITKGSTLWTNDTGSKGYASLITINSGDKAVKIQNITVSGAANINMTGAGSGTDFGSGINVVSSSNVTLNNVTSINNAAAGLIINSSNVTANNLNTRGNNWYGVNVDKRDSGNASFTLTGNGVLGESVQILSESPSFVSVNADGYTTSGFIGGAVIWSK